MATPLPTRLSRSIQISRRRGCRSSSVISSAATRRRRPPRWRRRSRSAANSWEVNKEAGRFYLFQRDIAAATRHFEKAAELMDGDFHAWAMLSTCYMASGDSAKLKNAAEMMIKESQLAVKEDPSNGAALGILAGGYALLGNEEKTREWIDRAILVDPDNRNMRYNFACILAAFLGDKEGAIKMLQSTIPMAAALQVPIAASDTDLDLPARRPAFRKDDERRHEACLGLRIQKCLLQPQNLDDLDLRVEHLTLQRPFALGRRTPGRVQIFFTTSIPSVTWPNAANPVASPPGPLASSPGWSESMMKKSEVAVPAPRLAKAIAPATLWSSVWVVGSCATGG